MMCTENILTVYPDKENLFTELLTNYLQTSLVKTSYEHPRNFLWIIDKLFPIILKVLMPHQEREINI
jgi:hypothetical protein